MAIRYPQKNDDANDCAGHADRVIAALWGDGGLCKGGSRSAKETADLLRRIRYHGVQGLLNTSSEFRALTPGLAADVSKLAMADAVREAIHRDVLFAVFDAFDRDGIPSLVLKGTAVAYLFHADPATRPRVDTDLFVPETHRSPAVNLLIDLGFVSEPVYAPVSQHTYRITRHGMPIEIDLHWRAANSEVVSRAFEFQTMLEHSVEIDRLHPAARAPSRVDMLCFAIMHMGLDRAYTDGDRLIWLHDIALIVRTLSTADWCVFVGTVERLGLGATTLAALQAAEGVFGRNVPDTVLTDLKALPNGKLSEYLSASRYGQFRRELAIRPRGEAFQFLTEVFLPSRSRLVQKYGDAPTWKLPYLYARRAAVGIFGNNKD